MAKKKAKKQAASVQNRPAVKKPVAAQQQANLPETEDEVLFDLSDPDEFRRAFIASEILNRKY